MLSSGLQFAKFCTVGALNTAIHYGAFLVSLEWIGLHYLLASSIGYTLGLSNSYLLNRCWTFACQKGSPRRELPRFLGVNGVALGIHLLTMQAGVEMGGLAPELSQILAIAVSTAVNFLGNKLWTFQPA